MAPRTRTVPRKLPRQDRARATIDAILTATARILVRDGFDRASTNRIAEEAGVSVGSLYQYFPNKEALVAALVERHVEEMIAAIESTLGRLWQMPLAEAAREIVALLVRAHAVDPKLHRVLVEQVPRVGRLERLHQVEEHTIGLALAYLSAHRDELRPLDLDRASFIVVQSIEALIHGALRHPRIELDDALTDEIARLIVRYLAP